VAKRPNYKNAQLAQSTLLESGKPALHTRQLLYDSVHILERTQSKIEEKMTRAETSNCLMGPNFLLSTNDA